MAMDRKILNGLLTKLGVDAPGKLSQDRAEKKLPHRLTSKGLPPDLNDDEKKLIEGIGFSLTGNVSTEDKVETATAPATGKTKAAKGKASAKDKPAPKAKNEKPTASKPRGEGGMAAFREVFKNRKTYERGELIAAVVKTGGCSDNSVNNYISLAKKTDVFGFKLTEDKTKDGKKVLTKVG